MNVFKLSGIFSPLRRHYKVQSSPLSSEKIHSKQYFAGETNKEPTSQCSGCLWLQCNASF